MNTSHTSTTRPSASPLKGRDRRTSNASESGEGLKRALLIAAVACVFAASGAATARFAEGTPAPVDRLVENLTRHLEQHPNDAGARYRLARVHYMAFSIGESIIATYGPEAAPLPLERERQHQWKYRARINGEPDPATLTDEQRKAHLNAAIEHFNWSIRLDGDNALAKLGLASLMEEAERDLSRVTSIPLDPKVMRAGRGVGYEIRILDQGEAEAGLLAKNENSRWNILEYDSFRARDGVINAVYALRDSPREDVRARVVEHVAQDWRDMTAHLYFHAFADAYANDSLLDEKPLGRMIAREAAREYIEYAEKHNIDNRLRSKVASAAMKALDSLPPSSWITPIIFSLDSDLPLDDLLAPDTVVGFDLDGTGREQRWPWVRPSTGILVWDPDSTGVITSGRQLFGSVTWWIFFDHGFQALSMLDDDADGRIAGDELRGLAVWFDADTDGVSDPGEVVPIGKLPVRSIAVSFDSTDGASLVSADGLTLTDGSTLPMYDWVTPPAEAAP